MRRSSVQQCAPPPLDPANRFLRFVMKVCAFFVGAGLLGIATAACFAIFGHHERFPSVETNPDGSTKQVVSGTYLWQVGLIVVVSLVIGGLIWRHIGSPEPDDW